jgi:hypothetical protein
MPVLKPLFAAQSADIGVALNSLSNGSVAASDAVDNSAALMQDYLIEVNIVGTQGATAFVEVRLAPSEDGVSFGTWQSAIPLGVIDFSVSPQRAFFSLVGHGGLYQAPQHFKVMVRNVTGAALSGSGNYIKHQGVQVQLV